ncbi:DMT family transporter [Candidatus Bipolaricaulota bacterium]|nr:DMT family transporter [Candidatus Bipolaricaulota bacterium]
MAALIWALSFVGVKVVLLHVGPFMVAGLRYFIAFLFLFPWLWQRRHSFPSFTKQQWSCFARIALFQYTIGNSAMFFALKTLPPTMGALCFGRS